MFWVTASTNWLLLARLWFRIRMRHALNVVVELLAPQEELGDLLARRVAVHRVKKLLLLLLAQQQAVARHPEVHALELAALVVDLDACRLSLVVRLRLIAQLVEELSVEAALLVLVQVEQQHVHLAPRHVELFHLLQLRLCLLPRGRRQHVDVSAHHKLLGLLVRLVPLLVVALRQLGDLVELELRQDAVLGVPVVALAQRVE
eukprot:557942-Prymnesium_polylepis.1